MTKKQDGGPAGNLPDVTVGEADRLLAEADRLFVESAQLGAQADLARAQSEIVRAVIGRRAVLAEAEQGLDRAQQDLARAVAFHDPVAAELEQVQSELATIDPDSAGNLDDRLAARQRAYALRDEVEPLRRKLEARQRAVVDAKELVRSYEADQVPMARAELERAVSALVNPPLSDMSKLIELAPATTFSRIQRVGLAMVNVANANTPHGQYTIAGVRQFLANTGQLAAYDEFWLSSLKRKLDPQTFATVERAMEPPEPDLYQEPGRPTPDAVRGELLGGQLGMRELDLPQTGSSEAAAQIRAQRSYRGPADWPTFNTRPNV